MATADNSISMGIDWSLAKKDTAAFIAAVDSEIKRLLASASAGDTASRRDAGGRLEAINRRVKETGVEVKKLDALMNALGTSGAGSGKVRAQALAAYNLKVPDVLEQQRLTRSLDLGRRHAPSSPALSSVDSRGAVEIKSQQLTKDIVNAYEDRLSNAHQATQASRAELKAIMDGRVPLLEIAGDNAERAVINDKIKAFERRAAREMEAAHGRQLGLARDATLDAQQELAIARGNPVMMRLIAEQQAARGAALKQLRQLEEQNLAEARARQGLTSRVSNAQTGAISTIDTDRLNAQQVESLNQQFQRQLAAQRAAAQASNLRSGALGAAPGRLGQDEIASLNQRFQRELASRQNAVANSYADMLRSVQAQTADAREGLAATRGVTLPLRQIAAERAQLKVLVSQQRAIEQRFNQTAESLEGTQLALLREKVSLEANAVRLAQGSPRYQAAIAEEQVRLESVIEERRQIEERALDQARRNAGRIAPASNVKTGALTTAPGGRIGRDDIASLNQQFQRDALLQQRATGAAAAGAAGAVASLGRSATATAGNLQRMGAQGTTAFQKLYANLHSTQGRQTLPENAPTFGRFLGSRALTTVGYGLSGGLLYGGLSFARELITEATELQKELGLVESSFEQFGGTVNGITFEGFREEILGISRDAATAADITASVTRQLAGAFGKVNEETQKIEPDFGQGAAVGDIALRLSQITGLPEQELTDSFSAAVLAFQQDGEAFEQTALRIANAVTGLEPQFGVLSTETIQFVADLAPAAAQLGFSAEQLAGFGAAVQSITGVSGSTNAENIGRIFAGLQENMPEVISILSGAGIAVDDLVGKFSAGDTPGFLEGLIEAYGELGESSQTALAKVLGGDRQFRTIAAVFERGDEAIAGLKSSSDDFTGDFEQRWSTFTDTVEYAAERLQRAVEEFGIALFEAGLGDALKAAADSAMLFVDVANVLLEVFGALNDVMQGLPATILAVAAALKAASVAGGWLGITGGAKGAHAVASAGIASRFANFVNPNTPGGLSPYQTGFAPLAAGMPIVAPTRQVVPRLDQSRVLTNSAGQLRGGLVGSALGGFAASMAPLIITAALTTLYSEASSVGKAVDAERENLKDVVKRKLEEGVSPERIRSHIGPQGGLEGVGGFRDDFRNAVRTGFGLFGDTGNEADAVNDAIQEFDAARNKKELEIIRELDSSTAAGRARRNTGSLDDATEGRSLEDIIRAYEEDPTDNDNVEAVERVIEAAYESDADTARALDELRAREEARLNENKEYAALLDRRPPEEVGKSVAALEALYADQQISGEDLAAGYRREAANFRSLYNASIGTGEPNYEYLMGAVELEKKAQDTILNDLAKRSEVMESVTNAVTGGDPAALLQIKQQQFAQTTDPEVRLQIALEIRDMQREILNQEAELLDSADAQIALLTEGIEADPSTVAILEALVTQINPIWQEFLAATFGSVEAAGDLVARAAQIAVEQGVSMAQGLIQSVQEKIAQVREFRDYALSVYADELPDDFQAPPDAQEERLQGILDDVSGANLPDVGGQTVADKARADEIKRSEDERKAEEARTEARARELAQLSIAEAQADGNPIKLAQLAQQRAQIMARFAEKDSEKMEAYAAYITATNQLDDAFRAEAKAVAMANLSVAEAQANGNPIQIARVAQQRAAVMGQFATTQSERIEAWASMINATNQLNEAYRAEVQAVASARASVGEAQANGDPVQLAQWAQYRAQLAMNFAQTESERIEAWAQMIQANNQMQDAMNEIAAAGDDLNLARSGDDPYNAAYAAVLAANRALATAKGQTERLRAQAERIRAERQMARAVEELWEAQIGILIASADVGGDMIKVAQLQLQIAQRALQRATATGAGRAERAQLEADLIRAKGALRDAELANRRETINYQLEIGDITQAQAITALQALLQIPNLTEQQIREINLEIKRMRDSLGQDFQFNLPTQLALPTAYEVRRLNQSGGTGSSYQDNRQISVNVSAQTNATPEQIASTVVQVIGQTNRSGAAPRRYF